MPSWPHPGSRRCPGRARSRPAAAVGAAPTAPYASVDGRLGAAALGAAVARHPLADGRPIDALAVGVWPRRDAEASPARGDCYRPSRPSAGQPIAAGRAYRWPARLGFAREGWTAPRDGRRVHPRENPDAAASEQTRGPAARPPAAEAPPPVACAAGCDPARPTQGLAGVAAAVPVRPRPDRCFHADPPPAAPPPKGGRPRRHGAGFDRANPATRPDPPAGHAAAAERDGTVRVRARAGPRPKQQAPPGRGTRQARPVGRGAAAPVGVDRPPRQTRPPQASWRRGAGPGTPDPDVPWRADVRRLDPEHARRCCQQALGWTAPRVRHPGQADRRTWPVVAASARLRLARPVGADRRLPRERPRDPGKPTPPRGRRPVSAPLPAAGTPAEAPKPGGRSPGRPTGGRSGRAPRYPALTKVARDRCRRPGASQSPRDGGVAVPASRVKSQA
jgi:hypothetical protein